MKHVELPYIITTRVIEDRHYNPNFGDDRICKCGHTYYRHFDTYADMDACGCKYCSCDTFEESKDVPDSVCVSQEEWEKLDGISKQFLFEAEKGGMRYAADNGEVCAWCMAYEGLFSMDIDAEPHSEDGFLVTLAE